jgi:sterol desaturase/sphingolipid hydroxylase (fatty acid hydroxylase superfamily)
MNPVLVRVLFPIVGFGWALLCADRGWGLFNRVSVPLWASFPVTVLALDLVAYLQHNLMHRLPILWRVHRLHHTDHDVDFTTGARFHPLEALFTTSVALVTIVSLGLPAAAVFVSELLSMLLTFSEHGNLRVPVSMSRLLGLAVVTPDMHRLHHSDQLRETNSNFGTVFPWWDRLFGTFLECEPQRHADVTFGLAEFADRKHQTLPWMLAQPFLEPDRQTSQSIRLGGADAANAAPVAPVTHS